MTQTFNRRKLSSYWSIYIYTYIIYISIVCVNLKSVPTMLTFRSPPAPTIVFNNWMWWDQPEVDDRNWSYSSQTWMIRGFWGVPILFTTILRWPTGGKGGRYNLPKNTIFDAHSWTFRCLEVWKFRKSQPEFFEFFWYLKKSYAKKHSASHEPSQCMTLKMPKLHGANWLA